jgi:hypothetical protein
VSSSTFKISTPSWSEFLRSQAERILACDFFTIETIFPRTFYMLFFIAIAARKLYVTPLDPQPRCPRS